MIEVNPMYCDERVMLAVRAELERKGCVQLRDFLTPESFRSVLKTVSLKRRYVPDRFSFLEGREVVFPSFVSLLIPGVKSGLLRVFGHRDYVVLHDEQEVSSGWEVLLDLEDMEESWGGWSSYVRDGEEVVRVVPYANALTIVRCDEGVRSLVKYVNHRARRERKVVFARVKFI